MCFTGMETTKTETETSINRGSTTVFPHLQKGTHKYTQAKLHRRASSSSRRPSILNVSFSHTHKSLILLYIFAFIFQIPPGKVTSQQPSLSPCQPFSSWPLPSSSLSCFTSWRPNRVARVRLTHNHTHKHFISKFVIYVLWLMSSGQFKLHKLLHQRFNFCCSLAFLLHDKSVLVPLRPQTFETGFQSVIFWKHNLLFGCANYSTTTSLGMHTTVHLVVYANVDLFFKCEG